MNASGPVDERLRVLRYWWLLELFKPQSVPTKTVATATARVVVWRPGEPLPWEILPPPAAVDGKPRVWQHTVYLGAYDLEATHEYIYRAFSKDPEAYAERRSGRSAGAGAIVNERGALVPGSAVLSSALWAVGRIRDYGVEGLTNEGFRAKADAFRSQVKDYEEGRRVAAGTDAPPAQDADSLLALLRMTQETSGVAGIPGLATDEVVIKSAVVRQAQGARSDDAGGMDFLNSLFLDDLQDVAAHLVTVGCSGALSEYLTGEGAANLIDRVDVMRAPQAVDDAVGPGQLPLGRWLSDPDHGLSLRQQFAVNQALNDLAPRTGLMGVNGPPGTGKTTMLRDILAGNVVERACRLAELREPREAFTSTTFTWKTDRYTRVLPQLREELTGFEMVLASANNAAVENVTAEIPAREAIHEEWRDGADYFAETATAVLATGAAQGADGGPSPDAWGMVAAILGSKGNRRAFESAFWWERSGLKERLEHWGKGPRPDWDEARQEYGAARQRVDEMLQERRLADRRRRQLPVAVADLRRCTEQSAALRSARDEAQRHLADRRLGLERAEIERSEALVCRQRHVDVKPRVLETAFTFGRAARAWRLALEPLDERLRAAEAAQAGEDSRLRELESLVVQLDDKLQSVEAEQLQASEAIADLQRQTARDRETLGAAYPDEAATREERELRAPWLDAKLDAARSELFRSALRLHEVFLANTAGIMRGGMRAALDVVTGTPSSDLGRDARVAAWQLFFLVVPLVSTTFASVGRMLAGIGPHSIGWLLIDEAGQASPQEAVGAIWRARRVISVGDPLQLQPVVTIPQQSRSAFAMSCQVSSDIWAAPRASVQTLADRVARYGTVLRRGDEDGWVSAPLTVHRRCDDPMFTLCNTIAYGGIMVNGVVRQRGSVVQDDPYANDGEAGVEPSCWIDVPAGSPGSHLQESHIARLEATLASLKAAGIPMDDVIAISPFRAVADRLESLRSRYPGLRAGTIHTAQGREAPVVILVLGGDPASPGAKAWAASTVNLVNVAASRARRRLYVIGHRASWETYNYFRELSAALPDGRVPPPTR